MLRYLGYKEINIKNKNSELSSRGFDSAFFSINNISFIHFPKDRAFFICRSANNDYLSRT